MPQVQERKAYSISEFCGAHSISRSTYYTLRKQGRAPATMRIGDRELITEESAADWRRQQTAENTKARSASTG